MAAVYILYGGPHTRAVMIEMVMAEGGIAYELRVVDTIRQQHRARILDATGALEGLPGVRRCMGLVMDRPKLRPIFDQLPWRRKRMPKCRRAGRAWL